MHHVARKFALTFIAGAMSMALPLTSFAAVKKIKKVEKPKISALQQPKITKVNYQVISESIGATTDAVVWPKEADTQIELPDDVLTVQISAEAPQEKTGPLQWAFLPVWTKTEPLISNLLNDAKNAANKNLTPALFGTKAKSLPLKISPAEHKGEFLTMLAFVKNGDKVGAAPGFPQAVDYVSALTFIVTQPDSSSDESVQDNGQAAELEALKSTDFAGKSEKELPSAAKNDQVVDKSLDQFAKPPESKSTPPTPVQPAPKPIESLVVTGANAANAPSGAASPSSEQVIGKLVLQAPANSGNQYATIKGITLALDFNIRAQQDRKITLFKTEVLSSDNLIAGLNVYDVVNLGSEGKFIQFAKPLIIEAGTAQVLTVTANTVDAKSNSSLKPTYVSVTRVTDKGDVVDMLNVAGKTLVY